VRDEVGFELVAFDASRRIAPPGEDLPGAVRAQLRLRFAGDAGVKALVQGVRHAFDGNGPAALVVQKELPDLAVGKALQR